MKPTLYLETTIPSYYTARPVRDVVALAHQEITRTWWDNRLPLFDVYISPIVLEEARQGSCRASPTTAGSFGNLSRVRGDARH